MHVLLYITYSYIPGIILVKTNLKGGAGSTTGRSLCQELSLFAKEGTSSS